MEESPKGKEKVTKAKAKDPGIRERVFGRLTEKRQEIGSGSSRRKRSRQGALGQLGETRKESTSMRRGMRRFEGRGKELWGSTLPEIFAVESEKSGDCSKEGQ